MSATLAKWMTLFLSVTIMFTPLLAYLDGLHRKAADQVLLQGLKEASIVGNMTDDIIEKMETTLTEQYNFSPSNIDVQGTLGHVPRGGVLEGEITIKRTPLFVINIFNQGSPTYTARMSIMSESLQ